MRVFLIGDAVTCAVRGQTTPDGHYNVERAVRDRPAQRDRGVLRQLLGRARALTDGPRLDAAHRSSMDEITDWTLWADRVIAF